VSESLIAVTRLDCISFSGGHPSTALVATSSLTHRTGCASVLRPCQERRGSELRARTSRAGAPTHSVPPPARCVKPDGTMRRLVS